jgi:GH25 family lysozyme M1 (1,4-beta-N-acetylmuramidase)
LKNSLEWLQVVHARTGRQPFIYTNDAALTWMVNDRQTLAGYPLWIAAYTNTPPRVTTPWKEYRVWQYSATGKVLGINGDVDLDVWS